jgi:NAD(P)-dependent dehydrogenase (short-subunit alcohol dehydrogenase family)
MSSPVLDKLHVMVTGVDTAIARDVVRLLVAEGASVIAADRDAEKLARLDRDVGLYRTRVETAAIDLSNISEIRLWETSLRAFNRLPHLMVCCCGSPACATVAKTSGARRHLSDVALSEHKSRNCPAAVAERVLAPTLFLHAEPLRRSAFDRALSVLRHPTLRGVLERGPGRGVFSPESVTPYVRIASHVYSMRRQLDGDAPARLRLSPPTADAPRQADAA